MIYAFLKLKLKLIINYLNSTILSLVRDKATRLSGSGRPKSKTRSTTEVPDTFTNKGLNVPPSPKLVSHTIKPKRVRYNYPHTRGTQQNFLVRPIPITAWSRPQHLGK